MLLDPTRPVDELLDRREELKRLQTLLRDGRNVLVYGPRRLGKSSLVLATLRGLDAECIPLYVDCTRVETDQEVADRILEELSRTGAAKWKRFWTWTRENLQHHRVRLVLQGDGGRLEVTPDRPEHSIADALEVVGHVAEAADRTVVLALDEFQAVLARDTTGGIVAAIRSVVQRQPNVRYILGGSVEGVLRGMVASRKAPFWKQLVEFPVAGIGLRDIEDDWPGLFSHGITEEAVDVIEDATGHATLRLIEVLQRLPQDEVTADAAREAVRAVAGLHGPDYERDLRLVKPGNQRRCLLGLARDRPRYPTGKDFIHAHGLGTPASARAAMKRLQDLEILDGDHRFLDPLFAHWLRKDG